ncbi:MAG: GGDEF domain-containing protein, partial [Desulfobacterales bacterium]|nr:GGDEF domain-containing protein [Desulfobacterales bacterium]
MPKDKANWFLEQIRETLEQNRLRTVQYTLSANEVKGLEKAPGPDGDIHFEGRIQPLPITLCGERAVVWSARNISSQHELEMKLQRLSETDALTGIFNRRKFLEQLDMCFRKCKRYNRPTALIIFDVDHFKQINDEFGHSAGDEVLCRLTKNCAAQLRQTDSLYRIGGEEFAVVLPETNAENAYQQAERLRQISEQLRMESRGSANKITISVGISEIAGTDASIEDVMKRADACLYKAKENGRNCVVGY